MPPGLLASLSPKLSPMSEKIGHIVVSFYFGLDSIIRDFHILLLTWGLPTFTFVKPKFLQYFLGVYRTNSASDPTSWNHSTTKSRHSALVDIFVGKAGELRDTLVY